MRVWFSRLLPQPRVISSPLHETAPLLPLFVVAHRRPAHAAKPALQLNEQGYFETRVGTVSKEVAYGNNRADFSFIAGGVVPGVLILKPDFPENKEDWPFLWGENEYVVNGGASYLFLVHAVNDLLAEKR